MNDKTKRMTILTALIVVVLIAVFGFSTFQSPQKKLEVAMTEMLNAHTEAEYNRALKKAEKAIKQGAKIDVEEKEPVQNYGDREYQSY